LFHSSILDLPAAAAPRKVRDDLPGDIEHNAAFIVDILARYRTPTRRTPFACRVTAHLCLVRRPSVSSNHFRGIAMLAMVGPGGGGASGENVILHGFYA
jgi:hypothetical protein